MALSSSSLSDVVSLVIISRNAEEVLLVDRGTSERLQLPHKFATNQDVIRACMELKCELFPNNGITNQPVELRLHKMVRIWSVNLPSEVALLPPSITNYCILASIDGAPDSLGDGASYSWFNLRSLRNGIRPVCFELLDLKDVLEGFVEFKNVQTEVDLFSGISSPVIQPSTIDNHNLQSIAKNCGLSRIDEIALQMRFISHTWPSIVMDCSAFLKFLPWTVVFPRLNQASVGQHVKKLFTAMCELQNNDKTFVRFEVLSFALTVLQQGDSNVSGMLLQYRTRLLFSYYAQSSDTMSEEQFRQFARDALLASSAQEIDELVNFIYHPQMETNLSNVNQRGLYDGISLQSFTEALSSNSQLLQFRLHWDANLNEILGLTPNLIRSRIAPGADPNVIVDRCRRVLNMTSEIEAACSSMRHHNLVSHISRRPDQTLTTEAFVAHGRDFTEYVHATLRKINAELNQLSGDGENEDGDGEAVPLVTSLFTCNLSITSSRPNGYAAPSRSFNEPMSDHYPNSAHSN